MTTTTTSAAALLRPPPRSAVSVSQSPPPSSAPKFYVKPPFRPTTKLSASSSPPPTLTPITTPAPTSASELIFFDGGAHYGDLIANLLLGFTLVWLPLTLAAVSRAFYLRYRFTDRRVTVVSGLTGQDRSDFPYSVIQNVQTVPRFIGEWGDIVITLQDGTKVDLRSVPKFREIAKYCLEMKEGGKGVEEKRGSEARGF